MVQQTFIVIGTGDCAWYLKTNTVNVSTQRTLP